jgi:hypothetical protein
VWVPGIVSGSEWGSYYEAMSEALAISVDSTGPNFGIEHLLDSVAESATLATFIGARTRVAWPTRHDLRRIRLQHPTPVYPWSLMWRTHNHHPSLQSFRDDLNDMRTPVTTSQTWAPVWSTA